MLSDLSLARLLTAIASREPTPGAGAAAGVALALGLACARKAAAISLRHDGDGSHLDEADARLAELGEAALDAAGRDAELFRAALADAPGARDALIDHGRAFLRLADDARAEIARAAGRIDPNVRGDMLAAQALVAAAETIARANLTEAQR
jgi:hypothetical protein